MSASLTAPLDAFREEDEDDVSDDEDDRAKQEVEQVMCLTCSGYFTAVSLPRLHLSDVHNRCYSHKCL